MGVVVGLGAGVGLLLVWAAFTVPPATTRGTGPGRLRTLLDRAGLPAVAVSTLVSVSVVLFVVGFLAIQLASRTPPVAVAFALMAAYLPFGVVAGRARRRQRELAEVWPDAELVPTGMTLGALVRRWEEGR